MESFSDWIVSGIAIIAGLIALLSAASTWQAPYRLRSIDRIKQRYGMATARALWLLIGVISLTAATCILMGVRPGYARPESENANQQNPGQQRP